jgi:DNA invertase Pin-like site-specific DNA recombinase
MSTTACIYARVSTAEQELRAFAAKRGWKIVEEYTDSGISGSKESRPALNRLLIDAKLIRPPRTAGWCLASLPASRSSNAS